jgi:hypothetical protein
VCDVSRHDTCNEQAEARVPHVNMEKTAAKLTRSRQALPAHERKITQNVPIGQYPNHCPFLVHYRYVPEYISFRNNADKVWFFLLVDRNVYDAYVPDAALLHKLKGFPDVIVQGQRLDIIRHNVFDGTHESKKDIFAGTHIIDQVDEPELVIGPVSISTER